MASNPVQEAVENYAQIVQAAAKVYEDALRKAEVDLRAMLGSSQTPGPPSNPDVVTMNRTDYENLQAQLQKVSEFIKKHPELQ